MNKNNGNKFGEGGIMKSKIQRLMALVMALALVWAGAAEALADSEVKAGTISNVNFYNGYVSWDAYPGTARYWVYVESCSDQSRGTSYAIDKFITELVNDGAISNSGYHAIQIKACNSSDVVLASWYGTYYYYVPTPTPTGKITGVSFSGGSMTWNAYAGTSRYWVSVDGCSEETTQTYCNIDAFITELVNDGAIANSGDHSVGISAHNSADQVIATWTGTYYYLVPTPTGTITNVSFANGKVSWDAYPGAAKYWIYVDGCSDWSNRTSYSINAFIDDLVREGKIRNSGNHTIDIKAWNSAGTVIATWTGTYYYVSPVVPPYPGERDIQDAKVKVQDQVYTGQPLEPDVTVTWQGTALTVGTDYSLTYSNNMEIGQAAVTVTGMGNYYGSKTVYFKINPKGVKITSLGSGSKRLTVTWKLGRNIDGYEIEYSLDSDFSDSKTKTVSKDYTTNVTLKKLKAKKTYYVRIRTWKKVDGSKYYSAWSAVKKAKTLK